jgi:predicted MFS family arabinose efflux permease
VTERRRGWSGAGRVLQLTAFVSTLDRFAMPPMILAISRGLGEPVSEVAVAAGAYYLAYGLMQPVWGVLGGRFGSEQVLRWTTLLAVLGTTSTVFAYDAVSLTLFRMLAGVGFSAAIPAALVYVGDTARPGRRHREVTDLMAGVALGTAIATAGAGLLAATVGWRSAFVLTGALALVLWFALRRLPPTVATRVDGAMWAPVWMVLRSPVARVLLVLAAVEGAVLLGTLTFLPAAVESAGVGPTVAGGLTAVFGVSVLVFAPAVGWLHDRVTPAGWIGVGSASAATGCGLAAVSSVPVVTVPACVLLGLAWATMHSTLQTWATEVLPPARPAAVSLFAGALFAGSAAAAVLAGPLADDGRLRVVFGVAAAAAITLGLVGTIARARWNGPEELA